MSGEEFLFYFCRQSDEISTRCWIVGFQLAIPSIQSNTLLIARKNELVVSNKDITSSCSEMYNHEEEIAECLFTFMMHLLMATRRLKL